LVARKLQERLLDLELPGGELNIDAEA